MDTEAQRGHIRNANRSVALRRARRLLLIRARIRAASLAVRHHSRAALRVAAVVLRPALRGAPHDLLAQRSVAEVDGVRAAVEQAAERSIEERRDQRRDGGAQHRAVADAAQQRLELLRQRC